MPYSAVIKKVGSDRNLNNEPAKDLKEVDKNSTIYRSPDIESRTSKVQSPTSNIGSERKFQEDRVRASVYLQG